MAAKLSTILDTFLLVLVTICLTSCTHYCLNYADMQDCDTQVKTLRNQVAKLERENRKLRLYSSNDKCDEVTSLDH